VTVDGPLYYKRGYVRDQRNSVFLPIDIYRLFTQFEATQRRSNSIGSLLNRLHFGRCCCSKYDTTTYTPTNSTTSAHRRSPSQEGFYRDQNVCHICCNCTTSDSGFCFFPSGRFWRHAASVYVADSFHHGLSSGAGERSAFLVSPAGTTISDGAVPPLITAANRWRRCFGGGSVYRGRLYGDNAPVYCPQQASFERRAIACCSPTDTDVGDDSLPPLHAGAARWQLFSRAVTCCRGRLSGDDAPGPYRLRVGHQRRVCA